MNNTNIENIVLKFVILLILMYNILRTLATEYMELRLVNSSLVKYSLFCIVVLFKYNIQIKVAV
ncbi:histidine kinase [Fusobacterium pseudoperiodonticum]|uniref:Histidine kinase n=2 Tax=Fusobacterium TaxID=848 RepID=A0AAD0HTA6_9FUSO|nr:histidine kinase [Fusobacterium pseudoperiodonticum]ATV61464.1 histidine kinase [Fusobacterium pseudoperiodonticum]AVQ24583.1 histidine kinase [Fusobacterium periodonticum]